MSPKLKSRRTEIAEIIEVPSSPSDAMDHDADPDRFAMQHRQAAVAKNNARSDLQRPAPDQRAFEMEAEIIRLRTELYTATIAGQHGIQEAQAHSRSLTRDALAYQDKVFRNVAQQYEHASAEAAEAAVRKERSHQEAEQQRQLNTCRTILAQVEESVSERESTLHRELLFHQESNMENVSAEMESQRQVIVQEAENALSDEKNRLSTVKSEYMRQLSHCQEEAQEGLHSANSTIQFLENSICKQEKVKDALNERIQSMQAQFENNNQRLRAEMTQMQNNHIHQLRQSEENVALSAQEINLRHMVAENKMNNTITSLRAHLQEAKAREKIFKVSARRQHQRETRRRGRNGHQTH